ncbi:UNVERIFIED_CONTAM: hypothetical protein GTU68_040303 [Idotea baltica]|nr:hypothetical protein [Idotea baltica]
MLFPELNIYLASQSPRRKDLLERASIPFELINNNVDEIIPEGLNINEVPEYLAKLKGDASKHELILPEEVIISADTIVTYNNVIYGKPKNAEEAKMVLQQLSGNSHQVITGVCLTALNQQVTFSETATVYFSKLSSEAIDYYVEKFQPYDKAGAYAIQEWIGLVGIEKINGCYFNIMGLPINRLVKELTVFSGKMV